MTRCLVTGASGLLGINFALQFCRLHTVVGLVNQHPLKEAPFEIVQADLSLPGALEKILEQTKPELIIHCAALANLEACEANPHLAWRINAEVPAELAGLARRHGCYLIHISTDAVFDGQQGNYTEADVVNPLSVYARSKLAGEQAVTNENPQAGIARVVFYGWSLRGTRSLGEFFVNHFSAGKPVKGFCDVIFCPLEVSQLARLLWSMAEKELHGVYHTVSSECWSKYDFGIAIARKFGYDENLIQPVSWKDGDLKAVRSPNLTLDTSKLSLALGGKLPGLAEGVDKFYADYCSGFPQKLRNMA